MGRYKHLGQMVGEITEIFRPPERLTVSQSAAKYRWLNNPGAYVGPWMNETTPYLVEVMDTLSRRDFNAVVFAAPAQCGKPLHVDTPIATPDGWTTMGELKIGDQVFDNDGHVTDVIYATEVFYERDCYRITFDDGSSVIADGSHRWAVADMWAPDSKKLIVKTTDEIRERYLVETKTGRRFRYSIPCAAPLELPEKDLPVHPYALGVYLGDGSRSSGQLTLRCSDTDHIAEQLMRCGYDVSIKRGAGNSRGTADKVSLSKDGLVVRSRLLATNHGGEKRIPAEYLRASYAQRLDLLRGLMDTDGTVGNNGACSIAQSNAPLADQIYELVVSLGLKAHRDSRIPAYCHKGVKKHGRESFRITFSPQGAGAECFTLPRQLEKLRTVKNQRRPSHSGRRFIRAVEPVESVPVRCISVSNESHLFLCGRALIPTHNTDVILNWLSHTVVCDPMDMILYQTSQATARDFSKRRVDRLHRNTPAVGERLMSGGDSDNVFDKHYRSGVMFTLSWPSINELSGRPVGRVALTDYDRMPQNVDREGSPFSLARQRTKTYRSAGKTYVESSPGFVVTDSKWLRRTPHEAPPCEGILSLFNQGDRRRWYWKCPHCRHWFEPGFELMRWPDSEDVMECAEQAHLVCPHCLGAVTADHRYELNLKGRWVKDGQRLTFDDKLEGTAFRSDIASFWLKGPAAAFAKWSDLVSRYLLAEQEFARTGSQEALQSAVNTDHGEPYYLRGNERERLPEDLKNTALALDDDVTVPENVRFLLACADVQKNRFCVQVFGVAPAADGFDVICIDRIDIIKSKRKDEDGDALWVKPATHVEDWWLLKEQVLDKVYPLSDGSGVMGIKMMACDSGGRDGVTANAYSFYRQLRDKGDGAHKRFMLIKGDGNPAAPRVRVSYPDSATKDRKAGARGEIPVLMINGNILKDKLNGMLDARMGDGAFLLADYLPDEVFVEMTVERRTPKGWEKPKGSRVRNEAWDLATYSLALCAHLRVESIRWDQPPVWAAEWPDNALVVPVTTAEPVKEIALKAKPRYDLSRLAADLA